MDDQEAQRQISAAYQEGKRDGMEEERKKWIELMEIMKINLENLDKNLPMKLLGDKNE